MTRSVLCSTVKPVSSPRRRSMLMIRGLPLLTGNHQGRIYIGVTTAGGSAKYTLQAVSASLLQSAEGGLLNPGIPG